MTQITYTFRQLALIHLSLLFLPPNKWPTSTAFTLFLMILDGKIFRGKKSGSASQQVYFYHKLTLTIWSQACSLKPRRQKVPNMLVVWSIWHQCKNHELCSTWPQLPGRVWAAKDQGSTNTSRFLASSSVSSTSTSSFFRWMFSSAV